MNIKRITAVLLICLLLTAFPAQIYADTPDQRDNPRAAVTKPYSEQAERLIVELDPDVDCASIAQLADGELVRTGPFNYCTLEYYPTDSGHKNEILRNVLALAGVAGAQWSTVYRVDAPAGIHSATTAATVNDPQFNLQTGLVKVRAPQAWQEGATGQGVVIAVIDTGVDYTHPDLTDTASKKSNIISGYNAITRQTGPEAAQDDHGHGTTVAGVIAAQNNHKGIVGAAYNAKVMPIKAMDKKGSGEDGIIADGIVWAVDQGAQIINLSIGSEEQTKVLDDAIAYAAGKGVIVVAASGNKKGYDLESPAPQADDGAGVAYPGAHPDVIAVAAVDDDDRSADFSLTGPQVRLSAPGRRIATTYSKDGETGIAYSTGTSIAAPFVSAAAALLLSKYPDLSREQVEQALLHSAYDLGAKGQDDDYGYGRLDIYRALKFLDRPHSIASPAALGWEGGNVAVDGSSEEPDAILTVPPGAFALQVDSQGHDRRINIALKTTPAPGDFPQGIVPAGNTVTISPWGEAPAEKVMTLTVNLDTSALDPQNLNAQIAYLYKWSGSRWLRVGGGLGTEAPTLPVNIYEPGTYRAGWSEIPAADRIAGTDRIQTALEIARYAFPTGADTVIVARADDFPDALAGAPLAYKYQAPVVLTYPDNLPAAAEQLIQDLAPQRIFILGGTGAVSASVQDRLSRLARVTRISGDNRYSTAAAVADLLGTKGQAVVVSGDNFPDAIAAASHAAVHGKPVLLTPGNSLESHTGAALRKHSVAQAEVIGGSGVVSDQVLSSLPYARRISGPDRFDTSARVIGAYQPAGKILFIATGLNYPDALTGGTLSAANSSNIMLVSPAGLTAEQKSTLAGMGKAAVIALGGAGAVPEALLREIKL